MIFDDKTPRYEKKDHIVKVDSRENCTFQELHFLNSHNTYNGRFVGTVVPEQCIISGEATLDSLNVKYLSVDEMVVKMSLSQIENVNDELFGNQISVGGLSCIQIVEDGEPSPDDLSGNFQVVEIFSDYHMVSGETYGSDYGQVSVYISGDMEDIRNCTFDMYVVRHLMNGSCCSCCSKGSVLEHTTMEIVEDEVSCVSIGRPGSKQKMQFVYDVENKLVHKTRLSASLEDGWLTIIQGVYVVLSSDLGSLVEEHVHDRIRMRDVSTRETRDVVLKDGVLTVL